MDTPQYIKALLMPNGKKPRGRRVWSIDLETVWLPFFTATNVMGETAIPSDALGAPLRLAYNADGSVKFSRTGRPVTKVVKDISDNVKLIRENLTASLQSYANSVIADNPDGYQLEVSKARQAGEPIVNRDNENLNDAIAKLREQELAEAVAQAKPKAKPKVKTEAEAEAVGATS